MDPADTVVSFSSSSPTPTPNPHQPTLSPIHPGSVDAGMADPHPGPTLVELASQFQQLMNATMQMQQQFSHLMSAGSQVHPAHPAKADDSAVDPSTKAVQSEQASATPVAQAAPAATAVHPTTLIPSSSHAAHHLKVATPNNFDGSIAKSEDFLNSLYLYFFGKEGLTDAQKITCALSYMKEGTAVQWAKRKMKHYQKSTSEPSWEEFEADFRKSFSDPDPEGTARHKLELLKQGSSSADDYVSTFKELMDDTGYNDAALMDMFERGLSKQLVDRIYTLPDVPETLDVWFSQALKFDGQRRRREERSKHNSSATQPRPSSHQSTNPPRQTAPAAKPTYSFYYADECPPSCLPIPCI